MAPTLYIGCDHGGYEAKCRLLPYLREQGYTIEDLGCHSTEIVRYPYYAARVAQRVAKNPGSRGILLCSTGIGMSIAANKFRGIRAALCTSTYMAKMTRLHNDSNILCLGGKISGEFEIRDMLDAWLSTGWEGGRHAISLGLIRSAEEEMGLAARCSLSGIPEEKMN